MASRPYTTSLDGLSNMSIARANKSVENLASWEDALAYAKQRIKELRQSLRVFQEKVRKGEPWPGSQKSATRN